MRLYLYKDNFCDPANNVGIARQFPSSKEIDEYLEGFLRSIKRDSIIKYRDRWRAFVTNDDVEFSEVDHFALFDEDLRYFSGGRVKEISLYDMYRDLESQGKISHEI